MAGTITINTTMEYDDGGGLNDRRPIVKLDLVDMAYTQKTIFDLVYDDAVADKDIFQGSMTDAKIVMIRSSHHGGDLKINAGEAIPIAEASGWMSIINPAGGITSLTITTTDAASFEVWIFA